MASLQALRPGFDSSSGSTDGSAPTLRGTHRPGTCWTVLDVYGSLAIEAGLPFLMGPDDWSRTVAPCDWRPIKVGDEILMGAHAAPDVWARLSAAPPSVRPYETENVLDTDSPWHAQCARLRAVLGHRRQAYNYSAINAEYYGDEVRPLRPNPAATATPAELLARPIDVLFYGAANRRRRRVIDQLRQYGLSVATLGWSEPSFGTDLAAYEKSAKIVLNVHHYMPGIFEAFRCVPAISRGSVVVSEDCEGDEQLGNVTLSAPYDQLASACVDFITSLHP